MDISQTLRDFPLLTLQNFSSLIAAREVSGFRKLFDAVPFEEYTKTELTEDERKELRFAPRVEVLRFQDPNGEPFTGFRNSQKDGVLIFTLLPGDVLPICAEFRHGCERVILNLPAGLIEPDDPSPKEAAQREFEEETGIILRELIPLNSTGIPLDARSSTRRNFFFLGIPAEPLQTQQPKTHKAEFIKRFLVSTDDWLQLMKMGAVEDCSIAGTLLAFEELGRKIPGRVS
ncbi:MAG: NUDIX domain-containing protein [bacterium]|nr:NUDIX domain-containing protein [bacterium]